MNTERMVVELAAHECHLAGLCGLHRQVESIFSDRKPQFPERYPNEMFATHVVGAMAELAASKALNLKDWTCTVNHFSKPDLQVKKGSQWIGIEVRYSPGRDDIKVKDSDPDRRIVLGVSGLPPKFEIVGFVKAGTVKSSVKKTSPAKGPPAWFAPPEIIRPIEELLDWLSR